MQRLPRSRSITPELCRQLLRYEPETGKLYWLPREGYPWFNTKHAGKLALTARERDGHLIGSIKNTIVKAHRVCWAIYYGEYPEQHIDHINGDPADNRICNLRVVDDAQNARNAKLNSRNRSGTSGVVYNARRDRWIVSIGGGRRKVHVGTFRNEMDAVAARKAAERRLGYHPNHGRTTPVGGGQ